MGGGNLTQDPNFASRAWLGCEIEFADRYHIVMLKNLEKQKNKKIKKEKTVSYEQF